MDAGLLVDLVEHDQIGRVTRAFEVAIEQSLKTDRPRLQHITQAEVKHRFDLCLDTFKVLRGDKQWSLTRIIDNLPSMLRARLDRVDWEPDDRQTLWVPDNSIV
jgi:hypothetical protein